MADVRFERELRTMLAAELDSVHGAHPRWADAPVSRRIARERTGPSRPTVAAFAVLAAAILAALALAVVVFPKSQPVATQPVQTAPALEPLPSAVSPSAFPTTGEVPLGRVAIATQGGAPALAVRVTTQPSAPDQIVLRIDIRVVGAVTTPIGAASFGVIHDNQVDRLSTADGADPLAIAAGAPLGTTVSGEYSFQATADEWADLGYYGTSTPAFTYPIHRPAAANPPAGTCPGLAEWAAASAVPADTPQPSISLTAADAPSAPTVGTIPVGSIGALASSDGAVGALVRVSNVRYCDRFPDERPDEAVVDPSGAQFMLADVEVLVLRDRTIDGWLADSVIKGLGRGVGQLMTPRPPAWFPGANTRTSLQAGPGFTFKGSMAWAFGDMSGQLTIGVFGWGSHDGSAPQFSYPVRNGEVGYVTGPTPTARPATPTITPPQTPLAADATAVLDQGGATTEVRVGRVQQVPRYTGVVPKTNGDVFLEFAYQSLAQTADYTWNPNDWVVVKADGTIADELWQTVDPADPNGGYLPMDGGPDFVGLKRAEKIPLGSPAFPIFQVAEVPATGRITLEYRPNGGPAVATWVLRAG